MMTDRSLALRGPSGDCRDRRRAQLAACGNPEKSSAWLFSWPAARSADGTGEILARPSAFHARWHALPWSRPRDAGCHPCLWPWPYRAGGRRPDGGGGGRVAGGPQPANPHRCFRLAAFQGIFLSLSRASLKIFLAFPETRCHADKHQRCIPRVAVIYVWIVKQCFLKTSTRIAPGRSRPR